MIFRLIKVLKNFGVVFVFIDIDMEVRVGEVVVFVGDNGVGKLMFVKIFVGVYLLLFGIVEFCGK